MAAAQSGSAVGTEGGQGQEGAGRAAQCVSAPLDVTHVYGPPGTSELVFAQLVLTGAHLQLETSIAVTEMVVSQEEVGEHGTPQPLVRGCDAITVRRLAARAIEDIPPLRVRGCTYVHV